MRRVPTECSSATGSPLAGQSLDKAGLPVSIIVTTIQRNQDLVVPSGNTKLEAGDELVLIGRSSDIDTIRAIASGVDALRDVSAPSRNEEHCAERTNDQEMRQ